MEKRLLNILKYVGIIGAAICSVAYIVVVLVLIQGFKAENTTQTVTFALVNAVTPAAIAIIGVVTSCLKVISSFKNFKNTTAQDIDELREDIKVIVKENKELKKTCRELTETVTRVKREADIKSEEL